MLRKYWRSMGMMLLVAVSGTALADGHGHGKHDRDDDRDHDLPPGLAKRDRLPPGLEKQLRVRGTLPPGLRKKMRPCPEEVERRLPPPPVGCGHVVIGGHVVLVNRSTYVVLDIFHLEL